MFDYLCTEKIVIVGVFPFLPAVFVRDLVQRYSYFKYLLQQNSPEYPALHLHFPSTHVLPSGLQFGFGQGLP